MQETVTVRKCAVYLVLVKIGESPSSGMSGNLITLATWDGSRCPFIAGSSTCVNARRVFGVAGDDEGHASKSTGTG